MDKINELNNFEIMIKKIYDLSEEAIFDFYNICTINTIKNSEYFIKAGDKTDRMAISIDGIFRLFYLKEDGKEFTKGFASPGMFVTSYSSILCNRESYFFIQALNDSKYFEFYFSDFKRICKKHNDLLLLNYKILEEIYILKEQREFELLQLNASERYSNFLKAYKDIEPYLKLYHIASYLGITPETLSRIRK